MSYSLELHRCGETIFCQWTMCKSTNNLLNSKGGLNSIRSLLSSGLKVGYPTPVLSNSSRLVCRLRDSEILEIFFSGFLTTRRLLNHTLETRYETINPFHKETDDVYVEYTMSYEHDFSDFYVSSNKCKVPCLGNSSNNL